MKMYIGPCYDDSKLYGYSPLTKKLKAICNIGERNTIIESIKVSHNEKLLCVVYEGGLIKFFTLKDYQFINEIYPVSSYYNSIEFSLNNR
mmetsp:Transcript_36564/g.6540  ORF Transcript_36564/g.6540 Transcript_36564/m.6540 type:complete len:90 (+) Transcript_36564:156-425(+)